MAEWRCAGCALLASLLLLPGGCSARHPLQNQPLPTPGLPRPAQLLHRSAAPRQSAYTEADLLQSGEKYEDGNRAFVLAPPDLSLIPDDQQPPAGIEGKAWALYRFTAPGYDRGPQVRLGWNNAPQAGLLWLGLSDWAGNRWRWFRNPESADRIDCGNLQDFFNPGGELLVVVLVGGQQSCQLISVQLGGVLPQPGLVASPGAGPPPLQVSLDASSSQPGEGSITAYDWDLDGDGSFETAGGSSPQVQFNYATAGIVKAAVRVTNSAGESASISRDIRVIDHWERSFGTAASDVLFGAASDSAGNVYAAGRLGSDGSEPLQAVLLKLDPFGELLWVRGYAGQEDSTYQAVALDSSQDVVVAGSIDTGGLGDCLVQKWDPDGTLLWSRAFGEPRTDYLTDVETYATSIFVCGASYADAENNDTLAARLAPDGSIQWSARRNANTSELARDLTLRSSILAGLQGISVLCSTEHPIEGLSSWRLDYDALGNFEGGRLLAGIEGKALQYSSTLSGGDQRFHIAGEVEVAGLYNAFYLNLPPDGASLFGGRANNAGLRFVEAFHLDRHARPVVCGWGGFGGQNRGFLARFDSLDGHFALAERLHGPTQPSSLYGAASFEAGTLYWGVAESAAVSWQDAAPNSQAFSASWQTYTGIGETLDWESTESEGNSVNLDSVLSADTGGGSGDLLIGYRGLLD